MSKTVTEFFINKYFGWNAATLPHQYMSFSMSAGKDHRIQSRTLLTGVTDADINTIKAPFALMNPADPMHDVNELVRHISGNEFTREHWEDVSWTIHSIEENVNRVQRTKIINYLRESIAAVNKSRATFIKEFKKTEKNRDAIPLLNAKLDILFSSIEHHVTRSESIIKLCREVSVKITQIHCHNQQILCAAREKREILEAQQAKQDEARRLVAIQLQRAADIREYLTFANTSTSNEELISDFLTYLDIKQAA